MNMSQDHSEAERTRYLNKPSSFATSRTPRRRSRMGFSATVVLVLLAAVVGFGYQFSWHSQTGTDTCTVTDKTATSKPKNGGTDYRIYTKECGVFSTGDDIFLGKFNSADSYSGLAVGHTYRINYVGWRMPLTSTFPNIKDYSEVTK